MIPHSLDLNRKQSPLNSPISTPSKRKVLGEIQNSPLFRPKVSPIVERLRKTPIENKYPTTDINSLSPVTSRSDTLKRSSKITKIFEERSMFKSNKENKRTMENFSKIDVQEETRDCSFGENSPLNIDKWSMAKLDFSDALPSRPVEETETKNIDIYVPQKETDLDQDLEALHDLEEEFDSENFDECTKYEIISTDSPDIISSGRTTSRKINSKNFEFGAPLSESEQSRSFNRPITSATRMLNFVEESFELTSPIAKRPSHNISVKKSLKFTETPTKNLSDHDKSESSSGYMSPPSVELKGLPVSFPSETTLSTESGFASEFEDPFLDIYEVTNSPKINSVKDLITGEISDNFVECIKKRPLVRSISYNPEASKVQKNLFPIVESPVKKCNKRCERSDAEDISNKRMKSNCESPQAERKRPVLHRAFSENNASIMSALSRSHREPDLIGDFSLPFALPLTIGDHSDLKSISCETLASLLRGEYTDSINDFQVIDCRYPYEYEGGHILGAVNLYTTAHILTLVNKPLQPKEGDKRNILVFHCEFSLERGPKLSRFLRSSDRDKNRENYPSLCYPEVYLLHEGYRAFYQRFPDLCSPTGYTAMLDPQHKHQLKKHRSFHQPSSSSSHPMKMMKRNRLLL
ncbi:unnamed protein product [Euphydryas editha]|nr:unnamed protein product [Euphydryas editha]